jgi:hypothetical protein
VIGICGMQDEVGSPLSPGFLQCSTNRVDPFRRTASALVGDRTSPATLWPAAANYEAACVRARFRSAPNRRLAFQTCGEFPGAQEFRTESLRLITCATVSKDGEHAAGLARDPAILDAIEPRDKGCRGLEAYLQANPSGQLTVAPLAQTLVNSRDPCASPLVALDRRSLEAAARVFRAGSGDAPMQARPRSDSLARRKEREALNLLHLLPTCTLRR